jgi:hypothetical protein
LHLQRKSCTLSALTLFVLAASPVFAANKCSVEQGQTYIDSGAYTQAVKEFTCVINAQPTAVDGYRGRIEAALMLGRYSDAARDHARITALVLPADPAARTKITNQYTARLKANPNSIPALRGASFARWWTFDYAQSLQLLTQLLNVAPNDPYGVLLRGSCRMLKGISVPEGKADFERAIQLDPSSPHVRFIVADGYTYGQPDPTRAFNEASLAINWGLDTPRLRAILATSYLRWNNLPAAAEQFKIHLDQVTTDLVTTAPLAPGATLTLPLVAGRTFEVPLNVTAGESVSLATGSRDFYDTILVLLAPDGTPVVASDDEFKYFAGIQWIAPTTGTYRMWVSSFESVNTGELIVARK